MQELKLIQGAATLNACMPVIVCTRACSGGGGCKSLKLDRQL